MTKQANERRMRELVARWRGQGGSGAAFARRHGVSESKFGYWRRLLADQPGRLNPEPADFVPVRLLGPTVGAGPLEIAFVSGERVLVHEGASAEALAMVVSALRTRC